jgi:uncharacterized protein
MIADDEGLAAIEPHGRRRKRAVMSPLRFEKQTVETMAEDLMRYDQLAQNALRGVVRDALRKVAKTGLPGEHHFYIAFNTRYPGVGLSPRLAERYPREMTVVLQHQYWNLLILEDRFEVELSFDNIPEKLVVPFNSIKGFLDPHVQFGLQFEVVPVETSVAEKSGDAAEAERPTGETAVENNGTDGAEKKVVSLDAFRKK